MALGLQDVVVVDRAELADRAVDRADEIGVGQRTHAILQRTREELVEARVAGDVGVGRFIHVDAVLADEPADQAGRHLASAVAGDAPGEGGQRLLRHDVLRQYFETVGHDGSPLLLVMMANYK